MLLGAVWPVPVSQAALGSSAHEQSAGRAAPLKRARGRGAHEASGLPWSVPHRGVRGEGGLEAGEAAGRGAGEFLALKP